MTLFRVGADKAPKKFAEPEQRSIAVRFGLWPISVLLATVPSGSCFIPVLCKLISFQFGLRFAVWFLGHPEEIQALFASDW